ncbi:MAG: tRNA (N6-threonylcarbamoyladenosine(37)-N6)-methyltransferase TrmO [Desulfurococcales archaeon ex4484_58]|nr:MAG: tRNA (N6-threonylcarbamoyladenosine(37)-N6)-methyltransferase TrmO [Desulfurococcales archaeon ex4484_58]
MEIVLKPIGVVRHRYSDDEVKNSWDGVDGVIEVYPEYVEGLTGIDGFSHLIIIAYLHKTSEEQRRVLKIKHRRLVRFGIDISDIPEVGVFASDSPHRPNPIALTIVELEKRIYNKLYVKKLDLFNETPVLDIKPYTSDRAIADYKVPDWHRILEERIYSKFGARGPV